MVFRQYSFVNHASDFSYIFHHTALNSIQTVHAKQAFEAEKRIGDLQWKATTLLLHAQWRWPDAINAHLWPYAICCANETRNICPTKSNPLSPLNCFCNSTKKLSYANEHHFGCPIYVLTKDIQDGKKARKWTDRTCIGINLGPSPRHASSVLQILNIHTGLVSPQFHCQYDDLFESTTGNWSS
jgi:hypothetical protein